MAFVVTGGCGFVGSSIAAELLRRNERVIVFDNLSRIGGQENLAFLRSLGSVQFVHGDIRVRSDIANLLGKESIECVFHLAGQVAMTTSVQDPHKDFDINVVGTINVLEAMRESIPDATMVYASSNKVYGELGHVTLSEGESRYAPDDDSPCIAEGAPLSFRTPYGCSKGAADQYVLEYSRSYSLRTVVFRHSTIYGGRQFSTFDQGWVSWFCKQALLTEKDSNHNFTVNGDGKQVRDLLHVDDAVKCYLAAHQHIATVSGQVFNIGGGLANSMSVVELLRHLSERLNLEFNVRHLPWRADDQRYFVADITKASALLAWAPTVDKFTGIGEVLKTLRERCDLTEVC